MEDNCEQSSNLILPHEVDSEDQMNEGEYDKSHEKIQQTKKKEEVVQIKNQSHSHNWVCFHCKNEMVFNCIQVEPIDCMPCITFALSCWPCKLITPLSSYTNNNLPVEQFITAKQVNGGYQMIAEPEIEAIEEFESNEQACSMNSKITNTSAPKPSIEIYDDHPNQYCCICNKRFHMWCLKEELPEMVRSIVLAVCWACESMTPLACFFETHRSADKVTN